MLHLDQGGKNQLYTWYFGGLLKESPNLDFDVFGLSYYPMWHGTMEGLQYNLNYLATTYNKEVCVVETAYAWTTEDGDGEGNVFISGDEEVGGYPATVSPYTLPRAAGRNVLPNHVATNRATWLLGR